MQDIQKKKKIRSDAIRAYGQLLEKKYTITRDWLKFEKENPELTSLDLIKELEKTKKINSSTIAALGKYSINKDVRIKSMLAYLNLMDERHKITELWLEIEANPSQKAPIIGKRLNIRAISVLFCTIFSKNKIVRNESNLAYNNHLKFQNNEKNDKLTNLINILHEELTINI